jgi:hypothetical protein
LSRGEQSPVRSSASIFWVIWIHRKSSWRIDVFILNLIYSIKYRIPIKFLWRIQESWIFKCFITRLNSLERLGNDV